MKQAPLFASLLGAAIFSAALFHAANASASPDEVRKQPGKYRVVTEMTKVEVPGVPPETAESMARAATSSMEICLNPQEANRSIEKTLRENETDECAYERLNVSGSEFDALFVCNEESNKLQIEFSGTIGPTSSVINSVTITDFPDEGQGRMEMTMRQERIGDCDE